MLLNRQVRCSSETITGCTNERNINFSVERAHCTVASFPVKNDTANLSIENLSSLVSSAIEAIQNRPTPTLAKYLWSNFTIQGKLTQSLVISYVPCTVHVFLNISNSMQC